LERLDLRFVCIISIATVDANGNITALKAGTVKITVTDDDGCIASKTLTVSPKASAQETPITVQLPPPRWW